MEGVKPTSNVKSELPAGYMEAIQTRLHVACEGSCVMCEVCPLAGWLAV